MRVESLTFLRFVAAIIVVIYHFGEHTKLGQLSPGLFSSGPEMVTFFFVLSGFVMVIAYSEKPQFNMSHYWINRISRIAPIYWVALLISILLFYQPGINENRAIVLNFTFLQAWFPTFPVSYNLPSWSISVEMSFYAFYPLLIFFMKRHSKWPGRIFFFAFVVWSATQISLISLFNSPVDQNSFLASDGSAFDRPLSHFPVSHLSSFLFGMTGGLYFLQNPKPFDRKISYFTLALSAIAIYLFLEYRPQITDRTGLDLPFGSGLLAPIFVVFIYIISRSENRISAILGSKPFVILGNASYGIYILQEPLAHLFSRTIGKWIIIPGDLNFYTYSIILVIVSISSFYCFERPIQNLIRKHGKRALKTKGDIKRNPRKIQ